jgi:hypothetical protein
MTTPTPIEGDVHAIVAGYVFGLAAKHGLTLIPDRDEHGNYLASAVIELPGLSPEITVRLVVPCPEVTR